MSDESQPGRLRKLGRAAWILCLAVSDLYAASLCIYLMLRALFHDRLWPVSLASLLLHLLLLPTALLLPLAILRRRRIVAAMLCINVTAFVWLFGALFVPQAGAPADAVTLTIMTHNAGEAYHAPPDQLAQVLRASGADIIALQELSDIQQKAIEENLEDVYPYQSLYGYHRDVLGKGLLSKFPILEAGEPFQLHPNRNLHMRAVVDFNGQPITIIIAHLPPLTLIEGGYDFHPDSTAEVVALAAMTSAGGPGILVGDFNMTDQNDNYHVMRSAGLADAFRSAGWRFGSTWPVHLKGTPALPLARIDYIWHTPHFGAVEAWVGPATGADHLPVVARLAWMD